MAFDLRQIKRWILTGGKEAWPLTGGERGKQNWLLLGGK
jgi:hypothetical protein